MPRKLEQPTNNFKKTIIRPSQLRDELSYYFGSDGPSDLKVCYDTIASVEGLDLLERRDYKQDNAYRCAQYVFHTILKEPWSEEGLQFPRQFWRNGIDYLQRRGYVFLTEDEEIRDGDVVLYRLTENSQKPEILHVGIYSGNRVQSKFSNGHIFSHDLHSIPEEYGNEAIFVRKVSDRYDIKPFYREDGILQLPANELRQKLQQALFVNDDSVIEEIPGFKNLEGSHDIQLSRNTSPIGYTFGIAMKEAWATDEEQPFYYDHPIWMDTEKFLNQYGYYRTNKPLNGDIVVYTTMDFIAGSKDQIRIAKHFGIMKDGKVISKFFRGPLAEHEIDAVPNEFGEEVIFLRKFPENTTARIKSLLQNL